MQLGCPREGESFFWWLLHASQLTHPRLRVLYRLNGGERAPESTLPLTGYRDSSPVRIGNAAVDQEQLDIYGDLMQTAWLYAGAGDGLDPTPAVAWRRSPTSSARSGASPTAASGRCAASRCTSPTPRSCAGWLSIGRCSLAGTRLDSRELTPDEWAVQADAIRDVRRRALLVGGARQLRSIGRQPRARRQPASRRADGLPERTRSPVERHDRSSQARARIRPAARSLQRRGRPRGKARAPSFAVRSGSSTRSPAPGASMKRRS